MAKQVRLTLTKAVAKANLRRADSAEKPITMNSLATQAGGRQRPSLALRGLMTKQHQHYPLIWHPRS
jgi:hypothetical protein